MVTSSCGIKNTNPVSVILRRTSTSCKTRYKRGCDGELDLIPKRRVRERALHLPVKAIVSIFDMQELNRTRQAYGPRRIHSACKEKAEQE